MWYREPLPARAATTTVLTTTTTNTSKGRDVSPPAQITHSETAVIRFGHGPQPYGSAGSITSSDRHARSRAVRLVQPQGLPLPGYSSGSMGGAHVSLCSLKGK
jgi:hypothetical protein